MSTSGVRVGKFGEVTAFLHGFYGVMAFVALLNLVLMRRPGRRSGEPAILVLIPARNEADNLARLLPLLRETPVFVFDDESDDGTGDVARSLGATVIRPREPLPPGWTGKNRACHELAKAAAEASPADWWLFLDADVYPAPGFVDAMRDLAATRGQRCPLITGFPQVRPGRGIEPLFLAWVGWCLLSSNPFGLVSRTGLGHNAFKNGQVHLWRATTYTALWPNERVRGQIMEDVSIGRLLAKERIPVEVANLSGVVGVRMYETWRQTLDGMSKNSYEITGNATGTLAVAGLFLFAGWGWLLAGPQWPFALGLLALNGLIVAATARTVVWPALLMPLAATIGAFTLVRSLVWRRTGKVSWKGRVYPNV